jgi:hypothetical protein
MVIVCLPIHCLDIYFLIYCGFVSICLSINYCLVIVCLPISGSCNVMFPKCYDTSNNNNVCNFLLFVY